MNFEALGFIKKCVREKRIIWTNHVNIRLKERLISKHNIINSISQYEIIDESYEDDFLPGYLVYTQKGNEILHLFLTVDFHNEMVTIVTSYKPTLSRWERDYKTRREENLYMY